jgi:hypothetical protein
MKKVIMKIIELFKRLFGKKPDPEAPFEYGTHCMLSFAINKYTQAPLRGCINDQKRLHARMKQYWPEFTYRLFQDSVCTWQKFEEEILKAFAAMKKGYLVIHYSGHGTDIKNPKEIDGYSEAFYFYNGAYPDYRLHDLIVRHRPKDLRVVFIIDCCFSTGITLPRSGKLNYSVPRYFQTEPLPRTMRRVKREIFTAEIGWIVFAACGERQTAADAFINNEYIGAFSYHFTEIMRPGVLFLNWQRDVEQFLPSDHYPQKPSLTGDRKNIHWQPFEIENS